MAILSLQPLHNGSNLSLPSRPFTEVNRAFSLSVSLPVSLAPTSFFFSLHPSRKYGANHREQYSPRTPRVSRNTARIHSQQRESDTHCAPTPATSTLGAEESTDFACCRKNWQLVQKCYFPKSRIAAAVGFLPGRDEERRRWWW